MRKRATSCVDVASVWNCCWCNSKSFGGAQNAASVPPPKPNTKPIFKVNTSGFPGISNRRGWQEFAQMAAAPSPVFLGASPARLVRVQGMLIYLGLRSRLYPRNWPGWYDLRNQKQEGCLIGFSRLARHHQNNNLNSNKLLPRPHPAGNALGFWGGCTTGFKGGGAPPQVKFHVPMP